MTHGEYEMRFRFDQIKIAHGTLTAIFGKPGHGSIAAIAGCSTPGRQHNKPVGKAVFFPNTSEGRRDLVAWSKDNQEKRLNSFLNSALWPASAARDEAAALGQENYVPLKFWCLWADLDGESINRDLLRRLTRKGCVVTRSGGVGRHRMHIRVLLDAAITDADEFRRLNQWLAAALNADSKFNEYSWLTMPESTRFKPEYVDGRPVHVVQWEDDDRWSVEELEALFAEHAPTPRTVRTADDGASAPKPARGLLKGALYRDVRDAADNASDRSGAAFAVMKVCVRAGLDVDTAAGILWHAGITERAREKYQGSEAKMLRDVTRMWPRAIAAVDAEAKGGRRKVKARTKDDDNKTEDEDLNLIVEDATMAETVTLWLLDSWLPIGELSIVAGFEDLGKSTLCIHWAARTSRGAMEGEWAGRPRGVLYIATEDSWTATIIPRLRAAGADRSRVFRVRPPGSKRSYVDAVRYLDKLKEVIQVKDIGLVIFDPIASVLGGVNVEKEDALRSALDPIINMAEECQVAIIGLKHFTKLESADPAKLMGGNRAWSWIARATIMLAQHPEDPEQVVVGVHKSSLGLTPQARVFSRESVTLTVAGRNVSMPRIVWEGDSAYSPQDALAARLAKERAATNTTKGAKKVLPLTWLESYLEDCGPTPRPDVIAMGEREQSFSGRTIDRAWANLREKGLGEARRSDGTIVWALRDLPEVV